jgi:hypothetical protein
MTDTKPPLSLVPSSTELPDEWDIEGLRVDQDFAEAGLTKKLLLKVPVRPPNAQKFVRVHPDWHATLPVI